MIHLISYNRLSTLGLTSIDPVPDLAVLMSSEAPTAPWTVTSPSGRQSSNSSSAFTESTKKGREKQRILQFDLHGNSHYTVEL